MAVKFGVEDNQGDVEKKPHRPNLSKVQGFHIKCPGESFLARQS